MIPSHPFIDVLRRLCSRTRQITALLAAAIIVTTSAFAAHFGKVVVIGGHASDLALDETRGLLYIANFTGNRVEVMSTTDNSLRTPIRVAALPNAVAVSADGRYLVTTHFTNFEGVGNASGLTIIDLTSSARRSVPLTDGQPLAVEFGNSPQAFVVTTAGFLLVDPATAILTPLQPNALTAGTLPVAFATFPPDIVKASSTVSGDGNSIHVLAQLIAGGPGDASGSATLILRYDITSRQLNTRGVVASPPLGPRVISTDENGALVLAGWGLLDPAGFLRAQFPYGRGEYEVGSHAIDFSRKLIYAQVPAQAQQGTAVTEAPVLHVMDLDNMTVRERLRLGENLAGPSVFTRDMQTLYAVSDSGVTVLPIGQLNRMPHIVSSAEEITFTSNGCDNRSVLREVDIVDPSGNNTDFILSLPANSTGVRISPSSGTTPTRVRIEVDPVAFQAASGTTVVPLGINSSRAINIAPSMRLLVNTRQPEQKGTIINVPGKIVDILADPVRNRIYLLRQDRNQVLVYDSTTFNQIGTLRTGNTPIQMAITSDQRYIVIGNDNSQYANVYDLDTLEASRPIIFPFGLYPRSIAVANGAMLATTRSASGTNKIARIDFGARIAVAPETLGIYKNDINIDSALVSSPSGRYILAAMPNGTVVLYDSDYDAFAASRQDASGFADGYVMFNDEMFAIGNQLVNRSLVSAGTLSGGGAAAGFGMAEGMGLRVTNMAATSPGVIDRIDLSTYDSVGRTALVEAPITAAMLQTPVVGQIGQTILPFTRTLAPLGDRSNIVVHTVSGITLLPWNFEAALPAPSVDRVVNGADFSAAVAPGGLVSIGGSNLADSTASSREIPWPTSLANVCATLNNEPVALTMVSSGEIKGQLPNTAAGTANLVVRTGGGTSAPMAVNVLPSAPAVFRNGVAGDASGIPLIYRTANGELVTMTNPVRENDTLQIYGTGIGRTSPEIPIGTEASSDPLARGLIEPKVTLGGVSLIVDYAGLAPNEVALTVIQVRVPTGIPEGLSIPLKIESGAYSTTISVRVVKP